MQGTTNVMAVIALCCFGLFGGAILYYGYCDYSSKVAFLAKAEPAEGLVTSVGQRVAVSGSGPSRTRTQVDYAKVQYKDKNGKTQEFEQIFGLIEGCPKKGAKVPVAYLVASPTEGRITTFASLWAGIVALSVVGVIFVSLGLISYKLLSS